MNIAYFLESLLAQVRERKTYIYTYFVLKSESSIKNHIPF